MGVTNLDTLNASTLGVTGAFTAASVAASGAVSGGSVAATGAVSGATVAASGNATVGGTLGVTGAVTLTTPLANAQLAAPNAYETLHFFVAGAQTVAATKAGAMVGVAGTITDVRAYLLTAATDASFIVDVHKNGTTIFTNQADRPTILTTAVVSSTTAPAVTAVAAGDRLTIDVDQVGSTLAGDDLFVSVTIKRAHVA